MPIQNYLQSKEFKKVSSTAADSAIKIFFRGLNWMIIGITNFIKGMFKMTFGGK